MGIKTGNIAHRYRMSTIGVQGEWMEKVQNAWNVETTERSENPIMSKKKLIIIINARQKLHGMKERKGHDIWRLHDSCHIIATQGPNKDKNPDPKKEHQQNRIKITPPHYHVNTATTLSVSTYSCPHPHKRHLPHALCRPQAPCHAPLPPTPSHTA